MNIKKRGVMLLILAVIMAISLVSCSEVFGDLFGDNDDDNNDNGDNSGGVQPITVYGADPNEALVNQGLQIAVSGDPLDEEMSPGKTVKLISGVNVIHGENVVVVTPGQITVDFDLTGSVPGEYDIFIEDSEGDWGQEPNGFTIHEYEVTQDAQSQLVTIDVSGGDDISYDFSAETECATDSLARDVTFNGTSIKITAGGAGGTYWVDGGYEYLEAAHDIPTDLSGYARAEGTVHNIETGQYFILLDAQEPDHFIVLELYSVSNHEISINFMIVHKISPTT